MLLDPWFWGIALGAITIAQIVAWAKRAFIGRHYVGTRGERTLLQKILAATSWISLVMIIVSLFL